MHRAINGKWLGYAAAYCALAALVIQRGPAWWPSGRMVAALVLLCGGAAVLALVLTVFLADWRRGRRLWQATPEELTAPPPAHRWPFRAATGLGLAVGCVSLPLAEVAVTPLAAALAMYALLLVGHRRRSNALGAVGMALCVTCIVSAALAWLPSAVPVALLGWAAAGVVMMWLARFWEQQLNAGRPWTTTGRLIPAVRHLGYGVVAGEVVVLAGWAPGLGEAIGAWGVVAWLALGLHWLMVAADRVAARRGGEARVAC